MPAKRSSSAASWQNKNWTLDILKLWTVPGSIRDGPMPNNNNGDLAFKTGRDISRTWRTHGQDFSIFNGNHRNTGNNTHIRNWSEQRHTLVAVTSPPSFRPILRAKTLMAHGTTQTLRHVRQRTEKEKAYCHPTDSTKNFSTYANASKTELYKCASCCQCIGQQILQAKFKDEEVPLPAFATITLQDSQSPVGWNAYEQHRSTMQPHCVRKCPLYHPHKSQHTCRILALNENPSIAYNLGLRTQKHTGRIGESGHHGLLKSSEAAWCIVPRFTTYLAIKSKSEPWHYILGYLIE